MYVRKGTLLMKTLVKGALALVVPLLLAGGTSWAVPQYLDDGALQNAQGGWNLPAQGSCPEASSALTRPDCLAVRLTSYTTRGTCVPTGNITRSWSTGVCNDTAHNADLATCENTLPLGSRKFSAGSPNVCAIVMKGDDRNKAVCTAVYGGTWVTAGACIPAWVMPDRTQYTPNLFSGALSGPSGPGDQCLRCHNSVTEYNGPRVRDVEWFLRTGHKNMARKVTPAAAGAGLPWAGPAYACSLPGFNDMTSCELHGGTWDAALVTYPSDDSADPIDWPNGKIGFCSNTAYKTQATCVAAAGTWTWYTLKWIYGDWLSSLPRAIFAAPPSFGNASSPNTCVDPRSGLCSLSQYITQATCEANAGVWTSNGTQAGCETNNGAGSWVAKPGASYSCGRCHTTGWTSDSVVNIAKEPEKSFSGIVWSRLGAPTDGKVDTAGAVAGDPNKSSSWDVWGISCTRCHNSVVENTSGVCTPPGTAAVQSSLVTQALCEAAGGTWSAGPPYAAPVGLSSHHNAMTSADASSGGYCSDMTLGSLTKEQCEFKGGTWYAVNCSDPVWPSARQCLDTSGCSNHLSVFTTSALCTGGVCSANTSSATYATPADCATNGGFWYEPGTCSNPFYFSQATCTAAGGAWAANTWNAKTPGTWNASSCSIGGGTCTAPQYVTSGDCTGHSGTWSSSGSGSCSFPAYTTPSDCQSHSGAWSATWSDNLQCMDAGVCSDVTKTNQIACLAVTGNTWTNGKWTGTRTRRGQMITSVCMNCHRQETGGKPYDNASANPGTEATVNPGLYLKAGAAHGTFSFVSHPHGNQFLNSPHGQFTGTFNQIGTATYGNGYGSYFQNDGEAANTGNGCTGCHDVHKSVVEEAFEPAPGQEGAIKEECTACHKKNLAGLLHPGGVGTPLEEMESEPADACVSCHMPDGMHLYRIKADAGYTTFPTAAITATTAAQCTAAGGTWSSSSSSCTVNANISPDGSFTRAVWVDMDHACGQCHGGGTAQASTTGSTSTSTASVTVTTSAGFLPGERVRIADAGALDYDDQGLGRGDLDSYIAAVPDATHITLVAKPSLAVSGKSVVQNPTKNGAGYMTRTQLGALAEGMHNDQPSVSFVYSLGNPNTQVVNLDASASMCSGSTAACDAYEWDCGSDGTLTAPAYPEKAITATCTYATAGTKTITLTVEQYGVNGASTSRLVNTYPYVPAPVVGGTCSFGDGTTENTWTATVTDTSTSASKVTVGWGDNTPLTSDFTSPFGPFTHTYTTAGTYTITHKAYNSRGESSTETCQGILGYFRIAGTVFRTGGVLPVAYASVEVKQGATFTGSTVRTVMTAGDGTYTIANLKPGAYSLRARKSGSTLTFSDVLNVTIGPSGTVDFTATGGSKAGMGKPLAQ